VLMTRETRSALLEWAARRDVLIVEDDPYGALHFDDVASAAETVPIKAGDRDGRVVYLSTFSKTVAPGFRVAWIAAPAPIAAKLEVAKQAADLCTGGLDQRIVYEVWKSGAIAARLPELREFYRRKRLVMEQALRRELGDLVSWPAPKGGFFLWAALPESIDTDALLTRAVAHAVVYVAGSAFYCDGRRSHRLRLSFSAAQPARIDQGIRRLAQAVREELSSTASAAEASAAG
jgi:2-aminoadipate transaminase